MTNTFEKEKNYLYYNTEKGTYKLDINTGIFYGLKNKPIKNNPPYFNQEIKNYYNIHRMDSSNVMRLIYCFVSGYYGDFTKKLFIELLPLMDSLDNLKIPFGTMYIGILVQTSKYFKSAIRLYNQLPKEEKETANFCDLISAAKRTDILKLFTPQQQITYRKLIFTLVNDNFDPKHIEKVKTIIHFINKYPHEFSPFEYEYEGEENEKRYNEYQIKDIFQNFFRWAELFNFEIDRKSSFLKQYYTLKNMEKTHLIEIRYNLNKYIYNKKEKALKYSNDDFTVVIPKTSIDFMNEANQQHNCVYNSYLQQVAKNNTYVVFIRKNEDLEKSYITCEINKQGEIKQYLEKYNSAPKDDNALAFKKEYQTWLREKWNEE